MEGGHPARGLWGVGSDKGARVNTIFVVLSEHRSIERALGVGEHRDPQAAQAWLGGDFGGGHGDHVDRHRGLHESGLVADNRRLKGMQVMANKHPGPETSEKPKQRRFKAAYKLAVEVCA